MYDERTMEQAWHPVAHSHDVQNGDVQQILLHGNEIVLWRSNGTIVALQDHCSHRGTRISAGEIIDNTIVCPFHGWRYNTSGLCVLIPSRPDETPPAHTRVTSYRVKEEAGIIWICLSNP